MTYLPSLGNVGSNAYLFIDQNATCQHLIDFTLNDLNYINNIYIKINL
jgi:hypothetical protein